MTSFYDLDYIIEINEKRLEQYSNAYQKNIDKFTNILVIYSAFTIFLIPTIQSLFFTNTKCHWLHWASFSLFVILFLISLYFTVRLLIPVEVAYLQEPKIYYETYLIGYKNDMPATADDEIDKLVKASYINELEQAVHSNNEIFKRKGLFYYRAFTLAMLASVPYLLCIGFQLSIKEEKVQKVEIINNLSIFSKNQQMSNSTDQTKQGSNTSSSTSGTTTKLPGVDNTLVRPSKPQMVKENFSSDSSHHTNKPKR